jgi:hypothetical protein
MSTSDVSEQADEGHVALRPVDVIQSAVGAFNIGDIDGYLRFFEPGCRRWIVGFDEPLTIGQVGDSLRELAAVFAPLHLGADALFGDDRSACARWRLRGMHVVNYAGITAKGSQVDVEQCEIYEVVNGLVVESWVYVDPAELFRQMESSPKGEPPR